MIRSLLVVLASVMLLGAARTPAVVAYRLGVEPQAGRTPLLTVEIRLRGDTDGETRIDLPDSFASGREAWRNVEGFTAKGASVMASAPAQRVLRHRPGARLTIRYRVRSAYDQDPQASERNPYRGAVIRPDWFAALGEFVFATPAGREGDAATLDLNRPPAGWQVASSVERGHVAPGLTANDVAGSITMGSLHLDVAQRPISGGSLRVATLAGGTL